MNHPRFHLGMLKNKKNLYLDLINSNKEFIKNNKVSNEILENIKYFETKIKTF